MLGREPWSSGYGRRLKFHRSRVQIPAPNTGWTWHFYTLICCTNCIVCFKKTKNKRKEAGNGPYKKHFQCGLPTTQKTVFSAANLIWPLFAAGLFLLRGRVNLIDFVASMECRIRNNERPETTKDERRGRETWSNGYGRRLVYKRLRVRISAS